MRGVFLKSRKDLKIKIIFSHGTQIRPNKSIFITERGKKEEHQENTKNPFFKDEWKNAE